MMKQPFLDAVPVLETIEKAGFEAYFVGGSVRDHILGRRISDVDIATSALPEELKKIFPRTTDVGIEHGTILVHYHGAAYEVTTFRAESGYSDFRRPDQVSFIRSLNDDLLRRDFTMNAMAMDSEGRIIDPYRGQAAIARREIITVGNPDERFQEDALRMLRALRFLSQLSFSIERNTFVSLQKNRGLLKNIAVERKTAEFEKMLAGGNRMKAIEMLAETGIHEYMPGLDQQRESILQLSGIQSSSLTIDEMWTLLFVSLKGYVGDLDGFLRAWKLPVQKIKKLKLIVSWLRYREKEKWNEEAVFNAGLDTAISVEKVRNCILPDEKLDLKQIRQLHEHLPIKNRSDLKVSGNDLMEWLEKSPGPWIGDLLTDVEKAVINGRVENEREKIREWLNGAIRN